MKIIPIQDEVPLAKLVEVTQTETTEHDPEGPVLPGAPELSSIGLTIEQMNNLTDEELERLTAPPVESGPVDEPLPGETYDQMVKRTENGDARSDGEKMIDRLMTSLYGEGSVYEEVESPEPPKAVIKTEATEAIAAGPKLDLMAQLFGSNSETVLDLKDATKPFAVALYKDGIWERRDNTIGTFVFRRKTLTDVPYGYKECKPSFVLKLPKLPQGILDETARLFREIMKKMSDSECMVQIFWDTSTKEYFMHVPEQYVAKASINFIHDKDLQNNEKYIWVLDIHSHNSMGAFFSGGDDRDEKSTRIFGVMGQLNKDAFESKWRAGCNGFYYNLEQGDLWDSTTTDVFAVPDTDLEKIKHYRDMPQERKAAVVQVGGPGTWQQTSQGQTSFNPNARNHVPDTSRWQSPYPGYQGAHGYKGNASNYNSWNENTKGGKNSQQNSGRFPQTGKHTPVVYKGYPGLEDDDDFRSIYSTNTAKYKITIRLSGDDVEFNGYKAVRETMDDLESRLKEGPTQLFESTKIKTFNCGSQVLLEMLDVLISQINENLNEDLNENVRYQEDLTDMCINFAMMLKNFDDKKQYLAAMAQEIGVLPTRPQNRRFHLGKR